MEDDDDLFFEGGSSTPASTTESSAATTVPVSTTMKNVVERRDPMQDPKVLSIIGALSGIIVVLLGMIAYYAYRPYRKREEIIRFISISEPFKNWG